MRADDFEMPGDRMWNDMLRRKQRPTPWFDYKGGPRPCEASAWIEVRTHGGDVVGPRRASEFDWTGYCFGPNETAAWRRVPEPPEEIVAQYERNGNRTTVIAPTKDTNPKDSIGDKKVPLWLCSPIAKAHWALGQFAGMLKYGAWNWRAAGVRSSVYISAMQRHIDAYESGEEFDPVDGSHHLGNIMACAAILLDAHAANKLTDDRPPSVPRKETYEYVEKQMAKLREQYADYLPGGPKAPRHYTIADTEAA